MTSDNSGSQVQLIGEIPAYFRFDSNPSTGYKLIVDDAAANGIFSFDQQFERFADYDPSAPVVGAGGTNLFWLTGLKQGSGVFRIAYARPWEYKGDWEAFEGTKFTYNIGFNPS